MTRQTKLERHRTGVGAQARSDLDTLATFPHPSQHGRCMDYPRRGHSHERRRRSYRHPETDPGTEHIPYTGLPVRVQHHERHRDLLVHVLARHHPRQRGRVSASHLLRRHLRLAHHQGQDDTKARRWRGRPRQRPRQRRRPGCSSPFARHDRARQGAAGCRYASDDERGHVDRTWSCPIATVGCW